MERLVREELERWDSESSIGQASARGPSPGGSSRGPRTHSRPSSGPSGVRYRLIAMISCQFLKLMEVILLSKVALTLIGFLSNM